jgi:hypothetical protein
MHQAIKWIATTWIVAAGIALATQTGAMAQNTQPNSPPTAPPAVATGPGDTRGPLPAPVGHRQPRQSDLPPDIAKKENQVGQDFRDLDDKLRICKGC